MKKTSQTYPLIKASAMVLFDWSKTQPSLLMIHRNTKISFGNAYAFPGGKCDKQDQVHHKQFKQFAKISAIREILQEIGILLLPSSDNFEKYRHKATNQLIEMLSQIWKNHLSQIKPILRFLTVQIVPGKRFDCIFYTPKKEVQIYNWNLFKKTDNNQDLKNLFHILINEQSLNFQWKSAKQFLNLSQKKQIQLFPPQIVMLNALKQISSIKQLEAIKDEGAFEPILMFPAKDFKSWMLAGDKQYPQKQLIQKQPQSSSKNQLIKYLKERNQKNPSSQFRRMQLSKSSIFLKSQYAQFSLLTYLPRKSAL